MKNKSKKYKEAIHWITENDEPTILDVEELSTLLTVVLVADLFKLTPEDVAEDVVKLRRPNTSGIAASMFAMGVEKYLIGDAVHYAKNFKGVHELMVLWDGEDNKEEQQKTLETLSKTIADIKQGELFDRIKQTYFACDTCLQKAGGKPIPGHIFTASEGDCEVCGAKKVTLIPWVDFAYPKNKKADFIAKNNRD